MKKNISKIGIIGLGRIGRCILLGLVESKTVKKGQIRFTTKHASTTQAVEKEFGISACKNNSALVKECDLILLAVKPQGVREVLEEIAGAVKPETLIVSVVTGVSTKMIEDRLNGKGVVIRAMPNTPALVGEGMTAICLGSKATEHHWKLAETLFRCVGRVARVEEKQMNSITGLSGSGPAYIYMVLESMTEGGIKVGLPRDLALELSAQTILGAAKMYLETGKHPAALKDEVTTPAGCTIDGLTELEEGKLRITFIKAVSVAARRAGELAAERGGLMID